MTKFKFKSRTFSSAERLFQLVRDHHVFFRFLSLFKLLAESLCTNFRVSRSIRCKVTANNDFPTYSVRPPSWIRNLNICNFSEMQSVSSSVQNFIKMELCYTEICRYYFPYRWSVVGRVVRHVGYVMSS